MVNIPLKTELINTFIKITGHKTNPYMPIANMLKKLGKQSYSQLFQSPAPILK